MAGVIRAVVFDLDGVVVDTEHVWDEVREQLTREWGGRYTPEAQRAMMGMSSPEWSRYLHEVVGLPRAPEEINREVVRRMLDRYRRELPLVHGAVDAVARMRDAGFALAPVDDGAATLVTMRADFAMRGGPLGALMAATVGRRKLRGTMRQVLVGLREHLERVPAN